MSATETTTAAATGTPAAAASPTQGQATVTALTNGSSGVVDSLVCQWTSCGERLPTPEQLYDHVCERHVGRKSTNNLNLTCQWGSCRTTTVKRDHITSHIRVHVPLKPHKCDFCGKAFKRPQDLKKHVKTHADDSVLLRSPEPNRGGGAYSASNTKLVADLQSLAATASGYYPDQHPVGSQPLYYQNAANPSAYHGGGAPQQSSAYGPVYYAVSQPTNLNAEYEMRKKAAFDALNEFFGDAKERRIDPSTYYDVGHRLMALQTIQPNGFGGSGYSSAGDYGGAAAVASAPQLLQPQYSLPLPNLRTKSDLLSIDQFLDQLQQTVYENPNQSAAAGVALPGVPVHSNMNYRTSHSPPSMSHVSNPLSSHTASLTPSTGGNDTPALTPASSVMSYTSAHSPSSQHTISPIQRPAIGVSSMYPTLPGVTAMEGAGNFSTGAAPPTGLGSSFEQDMRRRYSGGQLQKQAPGDAMDTSDDTTPGATPKAEDDMPKIDKLGVNSPVMRNSTLDPALRSPSAVSNASSDFTDRQQEAWLENIRAIEMLRGFIREKLERQDFIREGEDEEMEIPKTKVEEGEASTLYPVLKDDE